MSFNTHPDDNKQEYIYVATMINGDKVTFMIKSSNQTEKATYLKHFLEANMNTAQDLYFIDLSTGSMYNKTHIVNVKEFEVSYGKK